MRKILTTVLLAASMSTTAGTLTFEWTEPTTNVDGTEITLPLSYEIRYGSGTTENITTAVGTTTSVEIADEPAVYYAQIRTVAGTGDEAVRSEWSPVVTASVTEVPPSVPNAPTIRITFDCDGCNLQTVQ